jgi:hypothetical protein
MEPECPGGWIACIRVLMVSTGCIAVCSTVPATEPAIMCYKRRRGKAEGAKAVVYCQRGPAAMKGGATTTPAGRGSR